MHHTLYFVTLLACLSGIVSGISAARAEAKSTTCKLQVLQSSTPRGYISSKRNGSGEYGILTNSSTEAIEVTFTPKNTSTQMDLSVTGANVNTPALGAIVGFFNEGDDLKAGSYHYAYIGLTSRTPSGAVPQTGVNSFDQVQNYNRKIESAIWSFNSSTKSVTPQWVNTDRSTPQNILLYVDKQNVLIITGDKGKFGETFKEEFEAQGATPVEVVLDLPKQHAESESTKEPNLLDTTVGALSVTFSVSRNNPNQLNLKVGGASADMPMLGGIVGFTTTNDNLVSGSHHYAYIGLTSQTASGSTPVQGVNSFDKVQNFERKVQSAIWTYDSGKKQLAPQWVNADRTMAGNYLLHVADEKALVLTADKTEFQKVMNVTFSEVALGCVA
ncbi:hypothetical protein RhiTH_008028 [Rhizoctonia solani]